MTLLYTHIPTNLNVPQVHLPLYTKPQIEFKPFFTYEKKQQVDFADYSKANIFKNEDYNVEFSVDQSICIPVPRKAVQSYMQRKEIKKSLSYQVCIKFIKLKERNICSAKEAFEHVEEGLNQNFDKLMSIYDRIEKTKAIKKQSRIPRFNKASKTRVIVSKASTPIQVSQE